jgi:hypothetical protein
MSDTPEITPGQKAVNYIVLWKVALGRLFIRCTVTAATFYLSAMANTHWSDLDGDSRFKLILGLLVAVLTLISSYLDKTEKALVTGNPAPPDFGDTTIITKPTESAGSGQPPA